MIISITPQAIDDYKIDAIKLGLHFCQKTHYWGFYDGAELKGFTGILWYKHKAVFKNHFVPLKHRRQGIFADLFDFSLSQVKQAHIKTIEANCSADSLPLYIKKGAVITKQYKDWTKVQISL
jgi:predicted GNAT family acetyltransferase